MQSIPSFRNSVLRLSVVIGVLSSMTASGAQAADNKPSRIRGKVTASDGKPAVNLQVKIAPLSVAKSSGPGGGSQSGRRSVGFTVPSFSSLMAPPAPLKTVSTDSTGAYDFGPIPPGNYKVSAGDPRSTGLGVIIVDVEGTGAEVVQDITLRPPVK